MLTERADVGGGVEDWIGEGIAVSVGAALADGTTVVPLAEDWQAESRRDEMIRPRAIRRMGDPLIAEWSEKLETRKKKQVMRR